MNEFLNYIITNKNEVISLFVEHIELTAIALLAAILIGVPLGILISYVKPTSKPILAFANLVQAIPSMALLGLTIPILGIGIKPAIFLVVIYSLLPIIKNTYAGIMNINQQTLEAAEGIGLTKWQILFKVRLPMALPIIMTGVRVSAVSAVGLLTLAAFIGGGGLGYLVYSGIRTVDNVKILAGAIPACILALLVDKIFASIENLVTPISLMEGNNKENKIKQKKKDKIVVIISLLLIIVILFSSIMKPKEQSSITLATMDFTENEILAYMMEDMIENESEVEVDVIPDLGGSAVCMSSIQTGEIDGYIEYTGTIYVNILKKNAISDVEKVYEESKAGLKEMYDLEVLPSLNVNNTYTLSTTKEIAEKYNLKTISDLSKVSDDFTIISTLSFLNREDGLLAVKDLYNMKFKEEIGVDGTPRYTALMNGEGEIIDAFSTDGLLKKFNLTVLEDDLGAFPPYYAVPMFRSETLKEYPELTEITEKLAGVLTTDKMAELNYMVDEEGLKSEDVAYNFLIENGLI